MAYLNCPECGFTFALRFPCAPIEHCPRCLARRRRPVELFVSAAPKQLGGAAEARSAEPQPTVSC